MIMQHNSGSEGDMAKTTKKGGKTATLSLRLDPKDKFVLDYIVRVTGMPITTVVERAIQNFSSEIEYQSPKWEDFWDVSEGVRTLNMLSDENVRKSYDEEELMAFVREHWKHFSAIPLQEGNFLLSSKHIDVLWPKIDEYVTHWRESKATNPGSTRQMMIEDLKAAGLENEVPKIP
jgi:hypothetical protein